MADADRKDLLTDAIMALPEREILVIALIQYESLSVSEVAELLGMTNSEVRRRDEKARRRLKEK